MSNERESYKQIFKATSIFGGIQVLNIGVSIIKSKVVAVLLGPAGLGIITIFNTTSTLIASCTNLGVNVSSVKAIAVANQSEAAMSQPIVIAVIKKLIWLTGTLGMLVTVIASPWLSKISFGNTSYTFSFMLLGLSLLALQISNGQNGILQGLRQVKLIALSSLIGSIFGLIISIPLYFFFGAKGIVPGIVASSMAAVLTSWYFLQKLKLPSISVDFTTIKKEGKQIIKLGFLISLTSIFPATVAYIVRLFIANYGSIEDVGLYTAGFAIVGTYVGMVFAAMGTDYYPSLAEVADNNTKCNQKVNQQLLMSILILVPILIILIVFIKIGIVILYSNKFVGTVTMIQWASVGVYFQAFSFCIAYLFLAKGDGKLFFWNELIPNIYTLIINCVAYYILGLEGMGISYLIAYLFYFIQVYIVANKKYGFVIDLNTLKICILQFFLMITAFLFMYFFIPVVSYIIGIFLAIVSTTISFKALENRMGLLTSLSNKFRRK